MSITYIKNKKNAFHPETLDHIKKAEQWEIDNTELADNIIKKFHLCNLGDIEEAYSNNVYFYYNAKQGKYCHLSDNIAMRMIMACLPSVMIKSAGMLTSIATIIKARITKTVIMDDDENIINFKNGILRLDTMKLEKHSPSYYSSIQLNCNWSSNPKTGKTFEYFMNFFCDKEGNPDEALKIREMLLQFIGLTFSNVKGYRAKKSLFIVGAGNTGKSQLKGVVERIIGSQYVMNMNLKTLEGRWGLGNCFRKRIIGSDDQSLDDLKDLSHFKQITGGDTVFAETKGKNGFTFKYNGVVWICSNVMPKFSGDRGEHLYERFIIYTPKNVVKEEKRDKQLQDKLFAEREYIIYQAIIALKKLIKHNYIFTENRYSVEQLEKYRMDNDPFMSFLDECCVVPDDENRMVSTRTFFDFYREWVLLNTNEKIIQKKKTKLRMKELGLGCIKRTIRGRYFINITLSQEALYDYQSPKVPIDYYCGE